MTDPKFTYVSSPDILAGLKPQGFDQLIDGRLGVCFKEFFSAPELKKTVGAFYAAKPDWNEFFEGDQYALGESWYPYAEEEIDFEIYSQKTEAARATVERHIPGLENKVFDFLRRFAAPYQVNLREGWSGPGIMMFPADCHVARNGGLQHHDVDAFDDADLEIPDLRVFSFVCMLQKPESGGNLTIWDHPYDYRLHRGQAEGLDLSPYNSGIIEYAPGDLWMFNGLNPHTIAPFGGDTDRICLTFHIVRGDGEWLLWF